MANLSSYLPDGIDESSVQITGGSINGTTIGASTAAAGTFTTLTANDHVLVGGAVAGNAGSKTVSIGDAGSTAGGLQLWAGTAQTSYVQFGDESGTAANHYRGFMAYAHNGDSLRLGTAGSERMRITSDGLVGIGTDSPSDRLHVKNGSAGSVPAHPYTQFNLEHSTHTAIQISTPNSAEAGIMWADPEDSDAAGILYYHASDFMYFRVNGAERMRIASDGTVLIGKTGLDNTNAGHRFVSGTSAYASFVNTSTTSSHQNILCNRQSSDGTTIKFSRANSTVGTISVTSSATSYNTSSDERLKENIVDAPAGNIDAIRVRSFDWKVDGSHQTYGMVAQELVDVAPEAVTQGETWAVDYSKLVPMMIKEIQDLKAKVKELESR